MTTTSRDSLSFSCPFCAHVNRVPARFAGRRGSCGRCKHVIRVPGRRHPRLEALRALSRESVFLLRIELTCCGCAEEATYRQLVRRREGDCPECRGRRWDMRLDVRSSERTRLDTGWSLLGVVSAALGGGLFLATRTEEEVHEQFIVPQVRSAFLEEQFSLSNRDRLMALLDLIDRRRAA